jgi:cyclic beta-1,2-glucan synthetase
MYQLILEQLLGVVREGDRLRLRPTLHPEWKTVHVDYRYHSTLYSITLSRTASSSPGLVLIVDGIEQCNDLIILKNDGLTHDVLCKVRTPNAASSPEV